MMGCGEWAATHPWALTATGSRRVDDANKTPAMGAKVLGEILILFSPRWGK
jgi:hypothetical protein